MAGGPPFVHALHRELFRQANYNASCQEAVQVGGRGGGGGGGAQKESTTGRERGGVWGGWGGGGGGAGGPPPQGRLCKLFEYS